MSLLRLIQEGGYNPRRIKRKARQEIADVQSKLEKLKAMSHEEFMASISSNPFAVGMKSFYAKRMEDCISNLKSISKRVDFWIHAKKTYKPTLFDYVVKTSFKGHVREARKTIGQLVESVAADHQKPLSAFAKKRRKKRAKEKRSKAARRRRR